MQIAKIIHVLGNILWLGGGVVAAFTLVLFASESKQTRVSAAAAIRKVWLVVVTPGMLLSFAGGLINLLAYWEPLYRKAPWMHMKLTVGLIAAALTGVLSGKLRKAAAGSIDFPPGVGKAAFGVLLFSALAGVALVMLRVGQH